MYFFIAISDNSGCCFSGAMNRIIYLYEEFFFKELGSKLKEMNMRECT